MQGQCLGPDFVGRASHRPPEPCAPLLSRVASGLLQESVPPPWVSSVACALCPRPSPLWPDPLTKAFCAEVGRAWLGSQKPHGGQGGGRRGGWGRGLAHRAAADGEEKHGLVCLSGGSSTRWEFLWSQKLAHTQARVVVCVCVWGGGSHPICAAGAEAWWGFWLLFTFLRDWLRPGRGP